MNDAAPLASRLPGRWGVRLIASILALAVVLAGCASLLPVSSAQATTASLSSYRTSGLVPYDGAPLLSRGSTTPRTDSGVHDSAGVRMTVIGGRLYDHPVNQAEYGLVNVTTYQYTHDTFYLNRALAQANRIVARRVSSGNGWFFPYRFDFALHGGSDVEHAPWYSSMAQGLALALFCRLYAVTKATTWRTNAGYAFAAMTHGPSSSAPWTSWVDSSAYLWLEEYPLLPTARSDRTYNGLLFALMGVYEYWQTTRATAAATLFDGGVTTARHYFPSFRRAGWLSLYCLRHGTTASAMYHGVHEFLLLALYDATHASQLAKDADLLRSDYPPNASGTVLFSAGLHTGYAFSASGGVISSRSTRLARASWAHATMRSRIYGLGIYYLIGNGAFAGYWLREARPSQYLTGIVATHVYAPPRTARLAPGTYVGNRLDAAGRFLGAVVVRFPTATSVSVGSTAWVNAYPDAYLTSGPLTGTWIAMTGAVTMG